MSSKIYYVVVRSVNIVTVRGNLCWSNYINLYPCFSHPFFDFGEIRYKESSGFITISSVKLQKIRKVTINPSSRITAPVTAAQHKCSITLFTAKRSVVDRIWPGNMQCLLRASLQSIVLAADVVTSMRKLFIQPFFVVLHPMTSHNHCEIKFSASKIEPSNRGKQLYNTMLSKQVEWKAFFVLLSFFLFFISASLLPHPPRPAPGAHTASYKMGHSLFFSGGKGARLWP